MTDTAITPSSWSVPVRSNELRQEEPTAATIVRDWHVPRGMRVVLQRTSPRPNLPAWTEQFSARLNELIRSGVLEGGWNGHGSRPLHPAAVTLAVRVIASVGGDDRPFPAIVPTSRGGLQLDWQVGGATIEVDVDPSGSVEVFFEDPVEGKDWDAPLSSCEADVRRSLGQLAARSPGPSEQ